MLFTSDLSRLTLVPEGFEGNAVLPAEMATVPACVFSRCIKLTAITVANAKAGSTAASAFISKDGILYSRNEDGETLTLIAAPAGLGASASIASSCTRIAEGAFTGNTSLRTIIASGAVEDIATGDGTASPVPAFDQQTIAEATVLADERSAWESAGFTRFSSPARPGDSTTLAPDESGFIYTLMEDGHLSVRWAGDAPATGERTIVESATLHGVNYTVTAIEDGALRGQTELTALVLPDTIASIGANAFEGCTALASMSIPGSVRTIGEAAFEGCASLTEIALNQGTATISERAFAGTAIDKLTLPASVEAIGDAAFDGCASLSRILLLGAPVSVSSSALGSATGVAIYAPAADAPVWPVLPASGNTLHEYAMQAPASPLELTVGEEADLLAQEGALLKASGDIEIDCSYKGASIYADATGIVKAKAPGTSPVTAALSLDGTELAKATAVVIVRAAPAPVGEDEGAEGEAGAESSKEEFSDDDREMLLNDGYGNVDATEDAYYSDIVNIGNTLTFDSSGEIINTEDLAADTSVDDVSVADSSASFRLKSGTATFDAVYLAAARLGLSPYAASTRQDFPTGLGNPNTKVQVHSDINMWVYYQKNSTGAYSGIRKSDKDDTYLNLKWFQMRTGYTQHLPTDANTDHRWETDGFEHVLSLAQNSSITGTSTKRYFICADRRAMEWRAWACWPDSSQTYGWNKSGINKTDTWNSFGVDTKGELMHIYLNGTGDFTLTLNDYTGNGSQTRTIKPYHEYTLPTPTATYYDFLGWYNADGNKVTHVSGIRGGNINPSDITLTARWAPKAYTITFLNGDGNTLESKSYYYGDTPSCSKTPTKAATAQYTYAHSGWSPAITTVTGAKTYTPTFTATTRSYTIRFLNHDGAVLQSGSLEYGVKPSYSGNTPTKPSDAQYSYAFSGWSPAITSVTGAKDYRAQFKANLRTYTISYSLGGGANPSDQYTSYTYQSNAFTLKTPTRTGYTFAGWTGSNGTTPQKSVTISKGSSGNKSYTANWTAIEYTISYALNSGAVAVANKVKYTIETATFTLNNPTRVGYTFAGWTGSNGTTAQTSVSIEKGSTGDKSYTANWTPIEYTISYTLNGGSVATANKETYTIETDSFTLNNPTRTGYTFAGWTGSNGTTPQTSVTVAKGSHGNKSYTANWTPITYSISYALNSGSLPSGRTNPESYTIETATFTLANPERPGYIFDGWTITGASAIAGGGVVNGTSAQVKKGTYGNLTATANWTPRTYTVSFDKNVGDTGDNVKGMPESFTIKFSEPSLNPANQTVTLSSSVPKRVGYTFDGWRLQGTDSTGTQVDTVYQPGAAYRHPFVGDISFSAQWIENDGFRVSFYKFTGDAEDERIPFAPDYANLSYEDRFQLPGRGDVPDNDKVSGYYLYGWSYSKDAGADGSAEATTFTLPVSPTLDDRVSVRILLDKLGIEPGEDEPKDIKLYAVWQMVYSITCPTDSTAAIVLDASEKQVMRASEVALTSTTPAEIAVGAKSEYNASTFEKVFPDTRVRDVGFAFTERGSSEEKCFPLTGSSPYGWVSWQGEDIIASELTRIPKGSGAAGPAARREATLSLDFNPNSVNISHELQYEDGTMLHDEDGNEQTGSGLLMNGTRWKDPIARITWMFKPVEESALTYTLLPSMPAAGSAPGHGTGAIEADARPFEGD